jgi:nucleotide-binding universal stress UspA family protein
MKVLVATDGSKAALHAVKYTIRLLAQLASPSNAVTLISVHDDVGLRHARRFVGSDAVEEYLRELSDKELKPASKLLDAANVRHDMVIKTGHISQEIVDFARSCKFDLIVLSRAAGEVAAVLAPACEHRRFPPQAGLRQPESPGPPCDKTI